MHVDSTTAVNQLNYARSLKQVASELNISCDQYVTDFVYASHLFDVKKPPLNAVSSWLTGIGV